MTQGTTEPIRVRLSVPLPVEAAFRLFVDELNTWWPAEYTWSGDVLEQIAVEPREGGRCFEVGPHGFTCDWGRVLTFDSPRRIVFTWQISPRREPVPDPAQASEIEVRFEPSGAGTQVDFEHRLFERHGEGGAEYRAALASEQGWPYILSRYADAANS